MIIKRHVDKRALIDALLASYDITERESHKLQKLANESALVVTVDRFKSRRSLEQNQMYWKWLIIFGEHVGEDPVSMHEVLKARFLGVREIPNLGVISNSTTSQTTESFSRYMDSVHRLALEFDCALPRTDDEWRAWERSN